MNTDPQDDTPREDDPAASTIRPESEVDEASYESFPASDSPGYAGGAATPGDFEEDEPPSDRA